MFRVKIEIGVMWRVQRAGMLSTNQKRSRKSRFTVKNHCHWERT